MTGSPPRAERDGPGPGDEIRLVDKPAGITSHDVVAGIRRTLPRRTKVGHAGTLDPFATGLLLVLVGRATRVQRFLMALPKRYEVVARFGATSTTGDPEGEITQTGRIPHGRLELPTGTVRQRPPAYSAVKVGGRRAYELARAGETVTLAEREVQVYRFEEVWAQGDRRAFVIECSSGTYVRSLIADLGDAYCETLRRTRIGDFEVDAADPDRGIALGEALAFLPAVHLEGEAARRAAHGVAVPRPAAPGVAVRGPGGHGVAVRGPEAHGLAVQGPAAHGMAVQGPEATGAEASGGIAELPLRLLDDAGLVALAEPLPDGLLRPIVGFRG